MKKTVIYTGIGIAVVIALIALASVCNCNNLRGQDNDDGNKLNSTVHSPYAGQETRGIKSLSPNEIQGLMKGHGTPFGGMAKLAELNGYPGPRHILDFSEEMKLTVEQKQQIQSIYDDHVIDAKALGKQLIDIEKKMNDKFEEDSITDEYLKEKINSSAKIYGELRYVHLKTHLLMVDILSKEQVKKYNSLRGYASGNPCDNIPEGHDPEMWKLHNNCE